MNGILEWDQLLPYATVVFNWFPNEPSQESPHFLYFGCDPYLPHLATFLQLKLRYLDSEEGMTYHNKLQRTYKLPALNTKKAHSKQKHDKHDEVPKFKTGDFIMIKNFDKKSTWDAKYVPNFRIVRLIGTRQLEVSDSTGRLRKVYISEVHKILHADFIVTCILGEQIFVRKGKYINEPCILIEVLAIDAFLQDDFPDIVPRCQESGQYHL